MNRISHSLTLIIGLIAGAALVGAGLFAIASTNLNAFGQASDAVVEPNAPVAVSQVLSYQGRLLTPGTGQPKPDGAYALTFSIYNVVTGGTALWTETKNISVSNGAFTTLLGDTAPLPLNIFDGQELFLGVKVGDDAEATPRQRLAHTAYAMFAEEAKNAGTLDGIDSAGFAVTSHTHTGAQIVDNSIGGIDIADESITDADIKNTTRTIVFPANAINYESVSSGTIYQESSGLRWKYTFSGGAFLSIPRPPDWDGTSDVTLDLYFYTTSNMSGAVSFFIRPRSYNPGDTYGDATSMSGTPVAVSSSLQVGRQTFTIPASRFGSKSLWVVTMQRNGQAPETYTDDVVLMSVGLSYTAIR